ncbi:actin-binding LIM protein 2 isoform X3 [Halyomorpha halys]|uniref:actin-binding LIM protein 2 isoform X3 n=1 Tax=Halyomorpha halys TaxID=286706 RepID=UPI0006D4E5FD|nr:actin-binding LIM protein 2 isoform X3 [Halyomorpha halys]
MAEGNDSEDGKTYCQCCKKKCTGEVLRVQDKYFHIACFKCSVCKSSLAQGGFFCKDGQYYCTPDYQSRFGTKCATCGKYVEGEVVTALGNTYHQACFTCAKCKQAFPSGERVTYTGKIVLCSKCSNLPEENNIQTQSITECSGCHGELKEGQALIALDRQWHVWCFKCSDCEVPLHGEYMGKDGVPYCEKDYQKHFGVKCAYCTRYISGKVLQAGDNHHFHPTCARCTKCGDPFGDGEEMYLQGSAIWHPRCGPGPQTESLANGHSHTELDRMSNSEMQLSLRSQATSLNGSLYGIDRKRAGSPGLLLREYRRDYSDISRIYTYSYLTEEPAYLKRPIEPYDKPPVSPHFHRPPYGGGLRSSGKWSRQSGGMIGLVESLRETRPKSPHMNNEEPIELAHFPDAHPPRPNEKPKIERDDFPAPPYPYTDPERRRRWSDSYKGVPDSEEEDEVDTTSASTKPPETKLKKEEAELSKLSSGMGRVFLASVKERERLMRQRQLDPRNASRSPSASSQPSLRLRYQSPINASPSRNLDAPRPWDDEDTLDRCSSYRSSVGRSIPTIPTYNAHGGSGHHQMIGKASTLPPMVSPRYMGDFSYSGLGDKAPSTDFSSAKSDVSAGSISEVDRATMSVGGASYLRRSLPNMCAIQHPGKVYPYHLLITSNYRLPPDVDRCNLERHLSEAEFETLFQCTRSEFYRLPQWKRNDLKKRARLF